MLINRFCPRKKGLTVKFYPSLIYDQTGVAVEALLAALFVGMACFIILFSWIPNTAFFLKYPDLSYAGVISFVVLAMLLIYWRVAVYRKKRFYKGRSDPILMRQLKESCLAKDCGDIEKLLSMPSAEDFQIFNQMVLCKLQGIINARGLRMQDIRDRFRKSKISQNRGLHFEVFFYSPKEYDRLKLPREYAMVGRAIAPFSDKLEEAFSQLKACRRALFTVMSDYLEHWPVTQKEVKKLQGTYPYNPPEYDAAVRIVFANHLIDYLKKNNQQKLTLDQKAFFENLAQKKISQLKVVIDEYHKAWEYMIKSYENLI